jgi:hypothetical protein
MEVISAGRSSGGQPLIHLNFKRGIPPQLQKHQTVEITITLPHDPKGSMLQPTRKVTTVYYNTTFMEAVAKVQARWPGRPMSIRTLSVKFKEDEATQASQEKV